MSTRPRTELATAVTLLFVPGHRGDRFSAASEAGADLVICDLEDAVAPAEKDTARTEVTAWAASGGRVAVRINAAGTSEQDADLTALSTVRTSLAGVLVPMVETSASLRGVMGALPDVPILALVETARGIRAAVELAETEGVVRLGLGHLDLATDLSADPDDAVIDHCRHELVLASRTGGTSAPVDGITPDIRDEGRIAADSRRARRSGLGGKLCIHPAQVPTVAAAFVPSADEIAWARRVLAAGSEGVSVIDGAMVDAPVLDRARSLLTRVEGARS